MLLTLLFCVSAHGTQSPEKVDISAWIDQQLTLRTSGEDIPGITFVLVQGNSIVHAKGYGLADVQSQRPMSAEQSLFPVASLSKTVVAIAVMQLYEQGKIDLDTDINNYLNTFDYQTDFSPITIKQLLTHTAGIDDRVIGVDAIRFEDIVPLAQHLKDHLPAQIRPADEAFTYSNYGYALLGLIVEQVSGMPFHQYVKTAILQPLKMHKSGFRLKPNTTNNKHIVTGYKQKNGPLVAHKGRYRLDYPAGEFKATALDMGHYISMLLNHGSHKQQRILQASTIELMFTKGFKHFGEADNQWLLGFSQKQQLGYQSIGHSGMLTGFRSELLLLPGLNVGLFIGINASNPVVDNPSNRVVDKVIQRFIRDLVKKLSGNLSAAESTAFLKPPFKATAPDLTQWQPVKQPLSPLVGHYRFTRYSQNTLAKLVLLLRNNSEIEIKQNGDLLEVVQWRNEMIGVSDLTFYDQRFGQYSAFGRNKAGEIAYFFQNGTDSWHKIDWYESKKFQALWFAIIVVVLLLSIVAGVTRLVFVRNRKTNRLAQVNIINAILILTSLSLLFYALFDLDYADFSAGLPMLMNFVLLMPLVYIPLLFWGLWLMVSQWRNKTGPLLQRCFQSLIAITGLAFIPLLSYWNLIGFQI